MQRDGEKCGGLYRMLEIGLLHPHQTNVASVALCLVQAIDETLP